MSFLLWLFSRREERERVRSQSRRAVIVHDLIVLLLVFLIAVLCSFALSELFENSNQFTTPIFILAVALVALFTHGYFFGVIASLLGVFCVNYMFTFPYWQFNMSIAGYPLNFTAMLFVSLCISTLTSRIKRQEQLHLEIEMEKMRANLLRAISHDLRTPLTSIIGSSSVILEDQHLTEGQRMELLKEINKDARWLERITENLLSITKCAGEQVKLRKQWEAVEEIVSSAIVKFRRNHSDICLSIEHPDEILLAPMDATLIEQVLLNLFDNAVVHGRTTSDIRIEICKDQQRIWLRVIDNGLGIPEGKLAQIFKAHLSGHSDAHRNMGIGLSVCKSIIRAHGGDIQARNAPTGGAIIEFWIPSEEDAANEE